MHYQQALALALACSLAGCHAGSTSPTHLERAETALARGSLVDAQTSARAIAADDTDWGRGQLVLAAVAQRSGDWQAALKHLDAVPDDASPASLFAAEQAIAIRLQQGQLHLATKSLQYLLNHRPDDVVRRQMLADLYTWTGQRRLADQQLGVLSKANALGPKQLVVYTDYDRRDPDDIKTLEQAEHHSPGDPAAQLGLALIDLSDGDRQRARKRLEQAVAAAPDLATAQAQLGELLADESPAEFLMWYRQLPGSLREHPEIWYVRGLKALQGNHPRLAADCFAQSAMATPTSYRMVYRYALTLSQVDSTAAEPVQAYAQQLYDLRKTLSTFLNTSESEESLRRIIELLRTCHRDAEARTWLATAQASYPDVPWLKQQPAATLPAGEDRFSSVPFSQHSAYTSGLTEFDTAIIAPATTERSNSSLHPLRFEDQAMQRGVHFTYHQGQVAGTTGVRMQESTGGGVSVLDYDLDDWPDFFFTQGADWPLNSDVHTPSDAYQDRLFRNRSDAFEDITHFAGILGDIGYGQGCAAGDVNNDGFPDLYVANIGENRLLINAGDGTFQDATPAFMATEDAWTTSCLIADLDGDSHPDLFDVNYLEGQELYRRFCNESQCSPQAYRPTKDALWLSNGDGTFRSHALNVDSRWGAGLGIVALRLAHRSESPAPASTPFPPVSRRLNLFIANDREPNFLLVNSPGDASFDLVDEAFPRGVALNMSGQATAAMGIATGDVSGDGIPDLFVTNYKGEVNCLYVQTEDGLFTDAISGTGLLQPTMEYIKWGTQFLDADNDGDLDLIIANGHVGDFHLPNIECYMPTQLLQNRGGGTFVEQRAVAVGEYFERKLLGRSVALVDWNRDGRMDVVASSIAAPAAVLTNTSAVAGSYLTVRLHAVKSARDAFGAQVIVTTDVGAFHQQLIAGGGYQASNERALHFGLGQAARIEHVDVEWPSGERDSYKAPEINSATNLIEGRSTSPTGN